MRILQISHRHHIAGGSDAVYFATSSLLRRAGHEVIPFCMADEKNRPSRWQSYFPNGADTTAAPLAHAMRYFRNADARQKLAHLLEDAGPVDVAHLHIYHGKQTPAILPLLKARGIPVVHTLHEYKLACPVYTMERAGKPCDACVGASPLGAVRHRCKDGSLVRSAVMAAEYLTARLQGDVKRVDRFICVSDFQRQIMRRAGIAASKLATLHNFVDAPPDCEHDHQGYLLYMGRIEKLKGLETLIEAVRGTSHKLIIAGQGNWQAQMLKKIGAIPNISYIGFRSGKALTELISGARAVVVPSLWYENCPMSVLEAKAHGRPIIGADIGGIPELVRDGKDGFLFAPGRVNALKEALARLSATRFVRLSKAARHDAQARFGPATHLRTLLDIYAQAQPASLASPLLPA